MAELDLLKRQLALQRDGFGIDPAELEGERLVEYVRWNVLACVKELTEALDEVDGWKPWSHGDRGISDRRAYVEELAGDAMRFVANLLLVAGVDDDELHRTFVAKESVVRGRQDSGSYRG